jgi:hypothetical protein
MARRKESLLGRSQANAICSQFSFKRVNLLVSSFLIGTLFLSVTAVPLQG